MLLGTLGASLSRNFLKGKNTFTEYESTVKAGQNFESQVLILSQILKWKSIIKTNIYLMVFI